MNPTRDEIWSLLLDDRRTTTMLRRSVRQLFGRLEHFEDVAMAGIWIGGQAFTWLEERECPEA